MRRSLPGLIAEKRGLLSAISLFILFFLSIPSLSQAVPCAESATIAAGGAISVGIKEDGTVAAVGYDADGQLKVFSWTNIKSVAAADRHVVGLKDDGTVVAVGNNTYGQLNVSSWTNIIAIAAGLYHTVGVKEDGTVVAVGRDNYGQIEVSSWTNIIAIAADSVHTVGLKSDGTVVGAGFNSYGQLNFSSWNHIKDIATGDFHTVGLKEDGTVVAVGDNNQGQMNVGSWTNITAIAAGWEHTVGLKADGTAVAVGSNDSGTGESNVSSWTNLTAIAAGSTHTIGLKADGTVVGAGNNSYGQLNIPWLNITAVAAGTNHTVAVKEDGTVIGFGLRESGQLLVTSWTGIKAVAGGNFHTAGLKADGTVVATGSNTYGQLNVSSWTNIAAISAAALQTVGLRQDGTVVGSGNYNSGQLNFSSWANIKAVAAGYYHTVGLKQDGTVVAVGNNTYGPGQLNVTSWTNIKGIAAGYAHTVGLKEDGTVVAVGKNDYGQLNVSGWTHIKAIAAGYSHTVGLKEDGTVVAVGKNVYGQLNVSGWTHIIAVAGGYNHTVGLKEDATVVAAGDSRYDQTNVSWTIIRQPVCGGRDATPPVTTAIVSGTAGANGWYVSDVSVSLTATDTGSGVKEIHYTLDGTETVVPSSTASFTVSGDRRHTAPYYAKDNAGNSEDPPHDLAINIDTMPPAISASTLPLPNKNAWNNTDVTVTFTCNDTGSGIASCTAPVTASAETQGREVSGTAVDNAGLTATTSVTIKLDKTPPVIKTTITPAPNTYGWNKTDVTVAFECIDNGSGIASCPAFAFFNAEAPNQTTTGTAYDLADNNTPTTVTVNIDKTPPSITATVTPAPNSNGWNNTDVMVTFTCADSGSGIASCPAPVTVPYETPGQEVSGTAVDKAGLTATASVTIKLDKTPPAITITGISNGGTYLLGGVPVAGYSLTDNLSGVAGQNASLAGGDANGVGTYTYTVSATDRSGNTSQTSATYTVTYAFGGFLTPVSLNKPFKLGSTIPVKFQLMNAGGEYISSARAALTLQKYSDDQPAGDPIDATSTSGADTGNLFRYNSTDNIYIFNLSTAGLTSGTWLVNATLDDGTIRTAFIYLKTN